MKDKVKTKLEAAKFGWYLWVFPLVALGFSAYLLYQHFHQKGEMIKIMFEEASVMQPEKTRIRYRGVTIGVVKSVLLSEDKKEVAVNVLLNEGVESFAVEGSRFWLVTPKVTLEGLTGLDTILDGPYIAVLPGKPENAPQTEFKARSSDSANPLENTTAYFVETTSGESVTPGSSVTFRGMEVGTVSKITLAKKGQTVMIQLNIHNKYIKLIRTNTYFWRKEGIQADLGLFGSKIKINSLDSILHGGIEIATPQAPGGIAKAETAFPLQWTAPKGYDKWSPVLEY